MYIRVKKIVAKRDNNKTASVFRSSRTVIIDGGAGRGGGGGGAEFDDAVDSSRVGEDSELVETSSTRTMIAIKK